MRRGAIRGQGLNNPVQLRLTDEEFAYLERIVKATEYSESEVARILVIEAIARRVIDTKGKDLPVGANGKPKAGRRV